MVTLDMLGMSVCTLDSLPARRTPPAGEVRTVTSKR
jgi:hypothetical protein